MCVCVCVCVCECMCGYMHESTHVWRPSLLSVPQTQIVRWVVMFTARIRQSPPVLCPLDKVQHDCMHIVHTITLALFLPPSLPPSLPLYCLFSPSAKLPFGIDVHTGVGTACEGWIKIPKLGGVRRGWQRAYAIVCDFKVFLHEPSNYDIHTPSVPATHIFDIR